MAQKAHDLNELKSEHLCFTNLQLVPWWHDIYSVVPQSDCRESASSYKLETVCPPQVSTLHLSSVVFTKRQV